MRGDTVQIRLVGVNADNRADGKGKAGLTFMTTTYVGESTSMDNNYYKNNGGYRDVRMRKDYNEGEYKNTINSNVYQYLTPVLKIQDNQANAEMNNNKHSATSNATVEKVSIPSPLELNMNVTQDANGDNTYNGLTPTGLIQYNPIGYWGGEYNYLYSGNAPYKYYQNNTSNVSEYCKLIRGNGLNNNNNGPSCQGTPTDETSLWLRTVCSNTSQFVAIFYSYGGYLGNEAIGSKDCYSAIMLTF